MTAAASHCSVCGTMTKVLWLVKLEHERGWVTGEPPYAYGAWHCVTCLRHRIDKHEAATVTAYRTQHTKVGA